MAWNGSGAFTRTNGVYSGATIWAQDQAAGVVITASRFDTHDQDLASGINACLAKNGEVTATGNLPLGGYKITGLGVGSALTDSIRLDQVQKGAVLLGAVGGTANAITLTFSPAPATLTTGLMVHFVAAAANTGTVTITCNDAAGAGAKALQGKDNGALAGGAIYATMSCLAMYNGTYWQLMNPFADAATAWTPTIAAEAGGGSVGTTTVNKAVYGSIDGFCNFVLKFTTTVTGTVSNISATVPITGAEAAIEVFSAVAIPQSGATANNVYPIGSILGTTGKIYAYAPILLSMAYAEIAYVIHITGRYRI